MSVVTSGHAGVVVVNLTQQSSLLERAPDWFLQLAGSVLPETLLTNALLCRRCVIPKKLPDKLECTFSIDVTGTPHDICDVKYFLNME